MATVLQSLPGLKVGVFGMDVTADVASIVCNTNDDRQPNSAEIVLSSLNDRYIVTESDILTVYQNIDISGLSALVPDPDGIGPALDTSTFDTTAIDARFRSQVQANIVDPVKAQVLQSKVTERVIGPIQETLYNGLTVEKFTSKAEQAYNNAHKTQAQANALQGQASAGTFNELLGAYPRFPLSVGQCIFHTNDPVTIFVRDPFNPQNWYFEIRGKITDWRENVGTDGKRTVTLTVQDSLRIFNKARTSSNPGQFDVKAVAVDNVDSTFFSVYGDGFANLGLPDLLFRLVFGGTGGPGALSPFNEQYRYGANAAKSKYQPTQYGIGAFNYPDSLVYEIGPESSYDDSFVLGHAGSTGLANQSSVFDTAFAQGHAGASVQIPKIMLPPEKVVYLDESLKPLEDWQTSVDHIVPTNIEDLKSLCLPEFWAQELTYWNTQVDATGKLDVMTVMERIIQYPQWYPDDYGRLLMLIPKSLGSGSGNSILLLDLIQSISLTTEFISRLQMIYNLVQRVDFSFYCTPRGDVVCEMPLLDFRPEDFGVYQRVYTFERGEETTFESHFADEHIKTIMQVNYNVARNTNAVGRMASRGQSGAIVKLNSLVSQFGLQLEKQDPWGYIASPEAAAYYAYLKLSQMASDAWCTNVGTLMRPAIGPNRPLYFKCRDFISSCRGKSDSIIWGQGGSVSQTLKLNYRRGWSGLLTPDGSAKVYEPYAGRASRPIDYSLLFKLSSNASDNSTKQEDDGSAATSTTVNAQVGTSSSQIDANLAKLKVETQKAVNAFALSLGRPDLVGVDPSILYGSTVRTTDQNAAVHGQVNSFHLSGLATDIGNSGIARFNQAYGTQATVTDFYNSCVAAQQAGLLQPSTLLLPEKGANQSFSGAPDHVHFGLGEHASANPKTGKANS